MEATLTPPAFRAAIAAAREAGESAFLEIAEKSPSLTDLAQFDRPEPFVPDVLSPEVTLYRGAPDPDGRRVLVVFTGRGHGVTVPLACFLQRLPAAQWDVLVLCDHRLTHFRDGCLGMGASFPELAATVLRLARPYRSAQPLA